MIRKYREGDELQIDMSDESRRDYVGIENQTREVLMSSKSYTILDSNGEIGVVASIYDWPDGRKMLWALYDKYRATRCISTMARLVKKMKARGLDCFTESEDNDRQTRLHEILGFTKIGVEDGRAKWVVL